MEIWSLEITFFHVGIGIALFLIYLILSTVGKQIKLRRERKTPNILRNFEKVPGLHAVRHHNYTIFCGAHSNAHSAVYNHDRRRVQRLLRSVLQNRAIHVPDEAVAVSIPTWCTVTGDRFHQFHCRPPAPYCPCPTIVSEYHYTYKMVSARVQATFYHDRRCTCLAGVCIYLRIPDEPWFFGELPESTIVDLIAPGVKRWNTTTPRGSRRHRRVTVPTTSPPRHLWYVLSVDDSDQEEEREEQEEEDVEEEECVIEGDPPAYSTVLNLNPPPSYTSLFSNSTTKL